MIRKAEPEDTDIVSEILTEVADWLNEKGEKLWEAGELTPEHIRKEVAAGLFWIAEVDREAVGCLRFQLTDMEYWDDVPHEDSAFVHRVAVKRQHAGRGIASEMIDWARQRAKNKGKRFLRLDCIDRPKLRAVYESMGFEYHSTKVRTPYCVIRYEFDLKNLD